MNVGAQLRKARQARGLPLRLVAHGAGVSVTYLSDVERGVRKAPIAKVHALANALGLPETETKNLLLTAFYQVYDFESRLAIRLALQ